MTQAATVPFIHPATQGTSEQAWLQLLRGAQEWAPRHGRLIVAAPHPDDEVLGAGGLIQSWAADGQPVTILSVTDGEAEDPGLPGLDLVRRKELRNALRALTSVHVTIERTAIPDGKVCDHVNRLRNIVAEYAIPDATIIAPYDQDGHPDHRIVGKICAEVARAARIPVARYPVSTWQRTDPVAVRSLRWVRFSLTAAAQRSKARALQCFKSQLPPANYFSRPFEAFVL